MVSELVEFKGHLPIIVMIALKHILSYVQGTIHLGLHLSSSLIIKLFSYTDADLLSAFSVMCRVPYTLVCIYHHPSY